jgi:membrane-bound lytic murein transglycosylase D
MKLITFKLSGNILVSMWNEALRIYLPRSVVVPLRLFYITLIMLMLSVVEPFQNIMTTNIPHNYFVLINGPQAMPVDQEKHEMILEAKRQAKNYKDYLDNVLAGKDQLDYAQLKTRVGDYAHWIDWALVNVKPIPKVAETEHKIAAADRPCDLQAKETLENGIILKDIVCNQPLSVGSVTFKGHKFELPVTLEGRYRFWLVVYALMSAHDYALHLRTHPGVILEVVNASATAVGLYTKNVEGREVIEARREHYANLLRSMQAMADKGEVFTDPEMVRVDKAMADIADNHKFGKAAENLRVQRGQREFLEMGIGDSYMYEQEINKEFAAQGLPEGLINLAFVESSFNLNAVSKAGASGVFQIMPYVGRGYGMIVNQDIDERNDPIKSARVAARLLKDYYEITGSWPLAVTAYNHGITSIKTAIRKLGTKDLNVIVTNYKKSSFGFAGKNYYAGYLAMLTVIKNKEFYFPDVVPSDPIKFETITLSERMSIETVEKFYQVDREDLLFMNPDINAERLAKTGYLPQNYQIKIPKHSPQQLALLGNSE